MKEAPVMADIDAQIARAMDSEQFQPPTTPWGIRNMLWAAGLIVIERWQDIASAPVPAFKPGDGAYNAHWYCLLQNERGEVGEGWAYWVPPPRGKPHIEPKLRWANRLGQCFPKYWMPMPTARKQT